MGRHGNRNSEGFDDPTACGAINRADREIDYRRFKKTMRDLHNICAMNGFVIQGRVVLQDKTNGKVWRQNVGRPKGFNGKCEQYRLRLSQEENYILKKLAEKEGLSKAEVS